jgi:hypothetical protein
MDQVAVAKIETQQVRIRAFVKWCAVAVRTARKVSAILPARNAALTGTPLLDGRD